MKNPPPENHPLHELLQQRILILDGSMGALLFSKKLQEQDYRGERFQVHPIDLKNNPDVLNLTNPDLITGVHTAYLEAGADIIAPSGMIDGMVGAIRGNDIARLTRIPGIGRKTAERMVLELRDKLPEVGVTATPVAPAVSATEEDVLSALVNLGYQRAAAEKALAAATKSGKAGSFDTMFRDAMAALSK